MITFAEVMRRVREQLAEAPGKRRIYDKDIALALDLTPEYYAVIKKRGKIPYEAVAHFCQKNRISLNWILFGQKPEKLCNGEKDDAA